MINKYQKNYLCMTCKYSCKHRRTLTVKSLLIYCPKYEMKDFSYLRESQNIKPTKPEKILNDNTPNSIKYIGDAKKWITLNNGNRKNPDFIIKGQKKIIEVFGNYWHKNDNPQELINLYKQVGYDCIIFWEHEIYKDINLVKEKIEIFINQ